MSSSMFSVFNKYLFFFRYVNSVDKALKSFEYTSEWADLISALGKLNKVFIFFVAMYDL